MPNPDRHEPTQNEDIANRDIEEARIVDLIDSHQEAIKMLEKLPKNEQVLAKIQEEKDRMAELTGQLTELRTHKY